MTRRPRRLWRRAISLLTGAAVVLLYHRVYDPDFDPLLLSVAARNFADQMAHLRRHYTVLSLRDLRAGLAAGRLPHAAIAVTFDDGYADNLMNARPVLEHHRVPATVFVATGYVGAGREFWWDELERVLFLAPRLPGHLSLHIDGSSREWTLGAVPRMTLEERLADRRWSVLATADPTPLHGAYREIHALLSRASAEDRGRMLTSLREQTGDTRQHRAGYLAMTAADIRSLSAGGLVDIGAHTVTHPVLSAVSAADAAHEIAKSKRDLEAILERPVTSFAYPYGYRGAYTAQNVADVGAAGLEDAYSNFGGVVRPGADRYQLNRILVRDWTGDEFARRIRRAFGD